MLYKGAYRIKLFTVKHLHLEPAKEILHGTIVHAIPFSGHTLSNFVLCQKALVFCMLVLPTLV